MDGFAWRRVDWLQEGVGGEGMDLFRPEPGEREAVVEGRGEIVLVPQQIGGRGARRRRRGVSAASLCQPARRQLGAVGPLKKDLTT